MKKLLLLIVGLTMFCLQINAQVSTAFNNVGTYSGEYVGWDGSMTNPLVIKHIGNYDMEFYTNNAQRMTLKNTGELGIGTTGPSSWLHVAPTGTNESLDEQYSNVPESQMNNELLELFDYKNANNFNLIVDEVCDYARNNNFKDIKCTGLFDKYINNYDAPSL